MARRLTRRRDSGVVPVADAWLLEPPAPHRSTRLPPVDFVLLCTYTSASHQRLMTCLPAFERGVDIAWLHLLSTISLSLIWLFPVFFFSVYFLSLIPLFSVFSRLRTDLRVHVLFTASILFFPPVSSAYVDEQLPQSASFRTNSPNISPTAALISRITPYIASSISAPQQLPQ